MSITLKTLAEGDRINVEKGSRAGSLGVSGSVMIDERTDSSVTLDVSVGKFGINVDITLTVSWDADVATIVARGSSIGEQIFTAQIVEHSETSVVLRDIEGALADASLNLRDGGRGVLDAEIPQLGTVHFVLQAQ